VKVFCDHFDSWRNVGNFLSAAQGPEQIAEDAENPAPTAG
jgi:hypothetical protein